MTSQKLTEHILDNGTNLYYKHIKSLVMEFAKEVESIVLIGNVDSKIIEEFIWIPQKYLLNDQNLNEYKHTTNILAYTPGKKVDLAICLEVLEEFEEEFIKEIFTLSDRVLISVPYVPPYELDEKHNNKLNYVEKISQLISRDPVYSTVMTSSLGNQYESVSRRQICYYEPDKVQNSKSEIKAVKEISKLGSEIVLNSDDQPKQLNNLIEELTSLIEEQKKYFEFIKSGVDLPILERELTRKREENRELEEKIFRLKNELNDIKSQLPKVKQQKQYYLKEYNKIVNSTSWKTTAPIRKVGYLIKKIGK